MAANRIESAPRQEEAAAPAPSEEAASAPASSGFKTWLPLIVTIVIMPVIAFSLAVAGSDADFKAKLAAHDSQLRDFACGVLATKTIADLEKPGARNTIRTELMSGFNNILGSSQVQEIYLTEFAIQ